jgi:RNA polymerase sigma-70 factor (ECF subfamily)
MNPTNSGGISIAELRGYLLRYARLQLRNDAMAEDVVQDTLMVVHERAAEFRGESQHRTWAMGVLKNKIIDCFRRRQATVSLDAAESGIDAELDGCFVADGHWREQIPFWQTPHGQLERNQLRAALEACLQRLPPNTARVFMLREWLGWELHDVCHECSLSPDNVRQMMYRARMLLRECLQNTAADLLAAR